MSRRIHVVILIGMSLLLLGAGGIPQTRHVKTFAFGTVDQKTGDFIETDLISVKKSRTFGWQMTYKTDVATANVKEVLILPAPSQHWTVGSSTRVSFDKRVGTTVYKREVANGVLNTSQFWSWVPGDPFGSHVIDVYVDEKLVKSTRFELVP